MVRLYTCQQCGMTFTTARGLSTHVGRSHKQDCCSCPERSLKRLRSSQRAEAMPPPQEEEQAHDVPDLEMDSDAEEEEELLTPDHAPAAEDVVAAARAEARQMLRDPTWVQYAEEQLAYCEEGPLQDVGQLFPSMEQFQTEETYSFKKLYHEFPGASFGHELLRPDPKDRIDLSKGHPGACALYGE